MPLGPIGIASGDSLASDESPNISVLNEDLSDTVIVTKATHWFALIKDTGKQGISGAILKRIQNARNVPMDMVLLNRGWSQG